MNKIAVVILSKNEEKHIKRAIESAKKITNIVYVVDSGSVDDTVKIASNSGATVLYRKWTTHSEQFNWALEFLPTDINWVIRLDSDEYFDEELTESIIELVSDCPNDVNGFWCDRYIYFDSTPIKHGGVFPCPVIRVFRRGFGIVESRVMDEHIVVTGQISFLRGALIDENLNGLSFWIDKHVRYSCLEAYEYIKSGYSFTDKLDPIHQTKIRNKSLYYKAPLYIRAVALFLYRYFLKFGFLDGAVGLKFYFLHTLWYRMLVDFRIAEIERHLYKCECTIDEAIFALYGLRLRV